MQIDWLTIGMLVILALLIVFMFRSSRKRQRAAAELQSKVTPGADVMTNFGLFGTVESIDDENNKVQLEIAPGTVVTVHRQTVTRVIDPVALDESGTTDAVQPQAADRAVTDSAPEFGERLPEANAQADKKVDE